MRMELVSYIKILLCDLKVWKNKLMQFSSINVHYIETMFVPPNTISQV